jgi:hypothetical protein
MEKRGIAAIMLALGVIGFLCLLAVARLSPETLITPIGIAVCVAILVNVIVAIWILNTTKG